jgi:hypothetical protein
VLQRVADDAAATYASRPTFELWLDEGEELSSRFNKGEGFWQGKFQGINFYIADDEINCV